MKKKVTSRMPPDSDSLLHHTKRANYQAWILKHYDDPAQPPSPLEHGWCRDINGRIIPVISSKPMLPDDLHILEEQQHDLSAEDIERTIRTPPPILIVMMKKIMNCFERRFRFL